MTGVEARSRPDRRALLAAIACAAMAYAVYAATAFPGVGGRVNRGDSAKFQFLGSIGGVSHPPGNPLYLLVSAAARKVFWFAQPATVATHTSAVCAAAALGFLFDALRRTQGFVRAAVAVICVGLGPLFWTLSTEAEVYTMNVLFLGVAAWGIARWSELRDRRSLAVGLGAFVLAFGNHGTIVAALPAFVAVAVLVHRETRIPWVLWVVGALASLVALGAYAYIPLRARVAGYSELNPHFTNKELWEYLRAKQFSSSFNVPSMSALVDKRMPEIARRLGEQWLWPQLLLIGVGVHRAWHRARPLAVFCALAGAGFIAFTVLYDIQDSEGFYVPAAFVLGAFLAFTSDPGRPSSLVAPLASLVLMIAPAWLHLHRYRQLVGVDVVESTESEALLWDLPDVMQRLSPGARFVLPCAHYGCVEVWNYYRYADPMARAKKLEMVTMHGGMPYGLPSPPPAIAAADAARVETCTIRELDAKIMQAAGVTMRRIDRPARVVGVLFRPGVPIHCSVPQGAP